MERVTFLIERTGARVSCLLNPEALEARRSAGVVRRQAGGAVLGNPRTDDPLVATGGGVTEYDLRLLFDVDVANEGRAARPATPTVSPPPAAGQERTGPLLPVPAPPRPRPEPPPPDSPMMLDVRSLTQPIWALAETGDALGGALAPPRVRFIWGKSWNVPGVVLAVAERLERFDANGVPRRSWLSLRLRRVEERAVASAPPPRPTTPQFETGPGVGAAGRSDNEVMMVPVDPDGLASLRHDQIADIHYGDPTFGPAIMRYNDRDDLLRSAEGERVRLPPRDQLLAWA